MDIVVYAFPYIEVGEGHKNALMFNIVKDCDGIESWNASRSFNIGEVYHFPRNAKHDVLSGEGTHRSLV